MVLTIQIEKKVIMKNIFTKLVWIIAVAPVIYLAAVWKQLPEKVAMHYDLHGNPDRYGNKKELIVLVAILLAVNVFVYFLLTNIYRIDPKKYASENKERLRRIALAVVVFISAIIFLIVYSSRQGSINLSMGLIFSAVGLLFAFIGNYMQNMKPNYFAGFRLPWTLENAENWKKTHALGGKLWFAGGLFLGVVCLFTPPLASIIVFFTVMMILVIIPCVFSYRLYKQQKKTNAPGQ